MAKAAPKATLRDFLLNPDFDNTAVHTEAGKGLESSTRWKHLMFRATHGLPGPYEPGGSPWSESLATPALLETLNGRTKDILNIAVCMELQKFPEGIREDFLVDTSQGIMMKRWRGDGMSQTLACGTEQFLVMDGRFLSIGEAFQLQGWSRRRVSLLAGHSALVGQRLAGNMMSVPTVGAVLLAVLAAA